MHHYVYLITNTEDGKVYIGKHSTSNLDDGYMGSGKLLTRAICKHGIEKFRKEILSFFSSESEALDFESSLVNEAFVSSDETYNLNMGGRGSWHRANTSLSREWRQENGRKNGKKWWSNLSVEEKEAHRIDYIAKMKLANSAESYYSSRFTGRKHSTESKKKIGAANSIHQNGENNSRRGSMWIYHPIQKQSRSIWKEDYEKFSVDGWLPGRKIK